MYLVKVYVTYKESVLDPQGTAINQAIHRLGYVQVEDVRMGKYFELRVAESAVAIETVVEEICAQLLANVTMETYRYEIVSLEDAK